MKQRKFIRSNVKESELKKEVAHQKRWLKTHKEEIIYRGNRIRRLESQGQALLRMLSAVVSHPDDKALNNKAKTLIERVERR